MASSDPKQVIVDWLIRPSAFISESQNAGGWKTQQQSEGQDADPATIRFLKERTIPGRQVHSVAFESLMDGRRSNEHWTVEVMQDDTGAWRVCSSASGVGDIGPIRDHPWASLGGGGWPDEFHAGGRVIDNGLDIATVRLVAGNDVTLEDTVDNGLVLFITDQRVEPPIHAELYERSGLLVSRHEVLPGM